jgi:hypothetical protein
MKKLLIAGTVALMLVTVAEAKEQSISVGGGLNNGHSYSGDYSVDQDYTLISADYERNITSSRTGIKWGFGVNYTYSRFTRNDHEPENKRTIDSHMGSVYVKPYWKLSKSFQPFALMGAGWDLSSDASSPFLVTGAGADWILTQKWSLVGTAKLYVGGQRNYRQSLLSIKYSF